MALKIYERFLDGFLVFDKSFKKHLLHTISDRFEEILNSSKRLRRNYMKKLSYFIKIVIKKFLGLMKVTDQKIKIFYYLYKSLSKNGGNYFRQDSLYVLNRELNNLKSENNCNMMGKI
jgi:hypothetical protein